MIESLLNWYLNLKPVFLSTIALLFSAITFALLRYHERSRIVAYAITTESESNIVNNVIDVTAILVTEFRNLGKRTGKIHSLKQLWFDSSGQQVREIGVDVVSESLEEQQAICYRQEYKFNFLFSSKLLAKYSLSEEELKFPLNLRKITNGEGPKYYVVIELVQYFRLKNNLRKYFVKVSGLEATLVPKSARKTLPTQISRLLS